MKNYSTLLTPELATVIRNRAISSRAIKARKVKNKVKANSTAMSIVRVKTTCILHRPFHLNYFQELDAN